MIISNLKNIYLTYFCKSINYCSSLKKIIMLPDIRLKKFLITDLPTGGKNSLSSKKSQKTLKVARRTASDNIHIEDDFELEETGDYKRFFTSPSKLDQGLKFDEKGTILPRSIVGSPKLFENDKGSKFLGRDSLPSSHRTQTRKFTSIRRTMISDVNYDSKFKEKITQISENINLGKRSMTERYLNLRPDQKYVILKDTKALKTFNKIQEDWDKLERNLSRKVHKSPEDLLSTRAWESRSKFEELDYIEKGKNKSEEYRRYDWIMSLRHCPGEVLDAYVNIGSPLGGLYVRVKESPDTPCELIRKPGLTKSSLKTYKDSPYLLKTLSLTKSLRTPSCPAMDELQVLGLSKFPLELEAAQTAGLEKVKYNLAKEYTENEIITENYERPYSFLSKLIK
ncbi:unnamed protein product [Blepharisma stoltei]|uniref:Uncharacterized protein n=1 Tax=Blepharisma stoltei TaxID=1481888 RepID=A0AAU9JY15_9CILI|nr:unnamed protein product [Blepharisma stoltei]